MNAIKFDQLTKELKDEFSLNGKIPFREWYHNETNINVDHLYDSRFYLHLRQKASRKEQNYYGQTDFWLYQSLLDFPIFNKTVLIIGSIMPWYESIALEHGCKSCTVVEYRDQKTNLEGIEYIKPEQLQNRVFDCVFSISSYEHDGLGRYGDPINPNADIEAMSKIKDSVIENGIMYLAVPMGLDEIVWNAHRVYGKIRLPLLIKDWELISKYGITNELWNTQYTNDCPPQPILVLRNKK